MQGPGRNLLPSTRVCCAVKGASENQKDLTVKTHGQFPSLKNDSKI